jgi:hypothetical protein
VRQTTTRFAIRRIANLSLFVIGVAACQKEILYRFTPAEPRGGLAGMEGDAGPAPPPTSSAAASTPGRCNFKVVSKIDPTRLKYYSELGTLDVAFGSKAASDMDVFREAIRREVCAAGGDTVVAQFNDEGYYIRGAVYKVIDPYGRAEEAPIPYSPPKRKSYYGD